MVYVKRVGVGTMIASACLFIAANARAGLPTIDAANIAGTVSIVKNGTENLKGISDITNKVGELNTIVGDAAASISKFQSVYSDKVQEALNLANKVAERKAEVEAAKAEYEAEIQAQKDAYQAVMDSISSAQTTSSSTETTTTETTTQSTTEATTESLKTTSVSVTSSGTSVSTNATSSSTSLSAMSSANRVYDDYTDNTESLNNAEETESVSVTRKAFIRPTELSTTNVISVEETETEQTAVDQSVGIIQTSPINGTVTVVPTAEDVSSSNETQESASPASTQIKQFRVSPQIEKISSSTFLFSEKMAFASTESDNGVGNSYINEVYIVPMAQRCSITPESFINDTDVRNECMETIVRENNADNSFDSALSMKDCQTMIYNAVIALLAEATNAKYEAANYSDTLDEQDELAADSTDIRGDLTVIAMSNYQTQLLLNRISMNYASQLILETTIQLCAARKDVLGDSDLDESTDGE